MMKKQLTKFEILIIVIILLLIIIATVGFISFHTDSSYFVKNQYGDDVRIFGAGIYSHDSYFRAPIFIGSDATMLFLTVPLLAIALVVEIKNRTEKAKLFLNALLGMVLYYSASIAFGVTYNSLLLAYIALFATSLFALIISMNQIDIDALRRLHGKSLPMKGISVFLVVTGLALFLAWMPDIIASLISSEPLALIEVYTTEVTFILDMGIISPLMFICLYLLKKEDEFGRILLSMLLMICLIMGVMLPVQTVYQMLAGIELPLQAIVSKVGIFVLLAAFAAYFNIRLYKSIEA
jgi:hypothetical protein